MTTGVGDRADAGAAVRVRPLRERELDDAARIMRLAFGTYLALPDPDHAFGDADTVRSRWRADPSRAVAAELDGELIGSNIATSWGSVGFFGPLTVAPEHWGRGAAHRLLEATMELFAQWGTAHVGLYTFAASAKHVGLYQRFGFWPRFLSAVMTKRVRASPDAVGYATLGAGEADLSAARELTGAVHDGLDVGIEIRTLAEQSLGTTVAVDDERGLAGLAVCHLGAGSEAGSGTCYVKFGAVRPGAGAGERFGRLLDACEALAAGRGASSLVAGANAGRERAWKAMVERGFRREQQGVAMHRPNEDAYNRPDSFVIDDWR